MNSKEIDVKIKVIIETDYRYKYNDKFAPLFTIRVHNDPIKISHFINITHFSENISLNYTPTLYRDPIMLTTYIPDETIAGYITDNGKCKLMKYVGDGNFDYNYNRIKEELTDLIDRLYNKYKIEFTEKNIVRDIYEVFIHRYLNFPISDIVLTYFGIRVVNYNITKNEIEIEGIK